MDKEGLLFEGGTFVPPDNLQVKLWRYMDFTQFVSVLKEKGAAF